MSQWVIVLKVVYNFMNTIKFQTKLKMMWNSMQNEELRKLF